MAVITPFCVSLEGFLCTWNDKGFELIAYQMSSVLDCFLTLQNLVNDFDQFLILDLTLFRRDLFIVFVSFETVKMALDTHLQLNLIAVWTFEIDDFFALLLSEFVQLSSHFSVFTQK